MADADAPKIELVFFGGCPHVETTRRRLREVLGSLGLPRRWREWNQDDPATPERVRGLPSPTVLVGGTNVVPGVGKAGGRACSPQGAPPSRRLREALSHASGAS